MLIELMGLLCICQKLVKNHVPLLFLFWRNFEFFLMVKMFMAKFGELEHLELAKCIVF